MPDRRSTMGGPAGSLLTPEKDELTSSYGAAESQSQKRHTVCGGDMVYNKGVTWTIADDEETMDDVSIIINLLADLSPAGILPLSYGMVGTGYVPAMVLLVLFASAAGYMMSLIGRTIETMDIATGDKSYDKMWARCIGESTAWIPTFVVFCVTFGCCLAYACMFGDLFAGCMPAFGITFASRTWCLIILSIFPLLPLCWLKDLSALAPTSFGALVAVLFTLGMMVVRYQDGSYDEGGKYYPIEPVPPSGPHTFTMGCSSLLLVNGLAVAFLCHYNGPKYYREFKNHNPRKFGMRIGIAFPFVSVFFAIAMVVGYATFGSTSDGVILNNYAKDDMLANIGRVGMGLANVFSFPLMFSGLREQSLALLTFAFPSLESTVQFVSFQNVLSTVLLGVITVIAVLVSDASLVIGLVGSICGSATIYVLPCLLFDRAHSMKYTIAKPISCLETCLVRTIGFTGVVLMIAGAIATVML